MDGSISLPNSITRPAPSSDNLCAVPVIGRWVRHGEVPRGDLRGTTVQQDDESGGRTVPHQVGDA